MNEARFFFFYGHIDSLYITYYKNIIGALRELWIWSKMLALVGNLKIKMQMTKELI